MSSMLSDDKEVLSQGRKADFKGEGDAPLRDQISKKLFKQLKEDDIGLVVRKMWEVGNGNRSEWLERQRNFLTEWDEFLEVTDAGAFTGSSNLHLPVAFTVCKTLHSRLLQAVDGVDPGIRPRRNDAIESAAMLQSLMTYALKEWTNDNQGISETLDNWVWEWITTGVGIKKWRWDTKFSRYMDVVAEVGEGLPAIVQDPATGQDVAIPVPVLTEVEKEVVKKTFEGPVCDWVHPEDVLLVGGQGDPQKADGVLHRQYVTASDLWSLVDQKVFDESAVEQIIQGGEDQQTVGEGTAIKQDRAIIAGKSGVDSEVDLDRYEIVEAYLKRPVDGSGINSDIVVWVHLRSGALLKATYLRRMNKAGMRPFVKIDFYKRPGEDMGIGMVEVLTPLTREMDAMHNIRIDYGLISTMPFGFYRPSGTLQPEKLKLEPGMLIPVDNPQSDIFFPNLGNRTTFGFNEENGLMNMVERLTSISEINLGVVSSQQGATRTATGTRTLQNESSANLNVHLRRLVRGWKQSLTFLLHMLQQRTPKGFEFRVTGEDGKDYFASVQTPEQLAGDFDFEVTTDSTQSNPTVQQGNAQLILQMTQNPLLIQLGVVNSGNAYEAAKNMLRSLGVMDFYRFINRPPEHQVVLTPEEEALRVINGQVVPVVQNADHKGFIEYASFVLKSDQLLAQFEPTQVLALAAQRQQHEEMRAALEQAQAQQANVAQQQANIQQGAPDGSSTQGGQGGPI